MKYNFIEKFATTKGYKVIKNIVYGPKGNIRKLDNHRNYPRFNIVYKKKRIPVLVHRLVAYQKYGKAIYKKGIQVRHLDNNSMNFSEENILIGTASENMMDIPQKERLKKAIHASKHIRKFTDAEMNEIRKYHSSSYKDTMKYFNISSKGTLHYILNTDYKTKI